MAERDFSLLVPELQTKAEQFLNECKSQDIDLIVTCTVRSFLEQAKLYRQGRTLEQINDKIKSLQEQGKSAMADYIIQAGPQSGKNKVTNAAPGESLHNYGKAFDVVPIINGKCVWNDDFLWSKIGEIGKNCGLTWGGDWKSVVDKPHFQI